VQSRVVAMIVDGRPDDDAQRLVELLRQTFGQPLAE
jgi:hypothetical protein